ncbi:MAG: DUF7508 domain-containing protein [Acidimicrobiia bacterium]
MASRLTGTWRDGTEAVVAALPGQLGVFELAGDDGRTLFIGCADARSLFGLRSAVSAALAEVVDATRFRVEVTTAYHTRWRELLMVHRADHGALPRYNEQPPGLGRLSPA